MPAATTALILLSIAMGVALIARRLRLPYTVALVGVGLLLGAIRAREAPHLTKELLYSTLLPGLLFEAAFRLDARALRRNARAIGLLAAPGVAIAIALTTAALIALSRSVAIEPAFSWPSALVFASLIAATDPVAVVALFRGVRAPARLTVIIDGESLVNDGTAVVFYGIALGVATGATSNVLAGVLEFARVVGLGVIVGGALGYLISTIISRIDDAVVEITLTAIAAYGSFIVAEQIHASGVLATVTAGVVTGSYGASRGMSTQSRAAVDSFWDFVAFALNSIVFLLIGLDVRVSLLVGSWRAIVAAYLVVIAVRALMVLAVKGALHRTSERFDLRWAAVLTWGGLRGALSMVLALALPDAPFIDRHTVVRVTFGVVVLTIVVNGLTVGPLLRALELRGEAPR